MFDVLMTDVVTLIKADGQRFEGLRASVQAGTIFTKDRKIPIDIGDQFERRLPTGTVELYEVLDPLFFSGVPGMAPHYQSKVRRIPNPKTQVIPERRQERLAEPLRLFISHASDDADIAERLLDVIRAAMNLPPGAIRCTSVDGYRLPGGARTNDQLRRETQDTEAFIGIVSADAVRSMYVMFELGARWGTDKHLLPLLAHGFPALSLDGPLAGINALPADNAAQVRQFLEELSERFGLKLNSAAAYEKQLTALVQMNPRVGRSAAPEPPAGYVDGESVNILLALANSDEGLSVEQVASAFGMHRQKAQHYLDRLAGEGYISEYGNDGETVGYDRQEGPSLSGRKQSAVNPPQDSQA